MGVYIKDMEMPKSCCACHLKMNCDDCEGLECVCVPLHQQIGYFDDLLADKRRDDCPLVPVPEHGDLIDRDAYEKLLRGLGSRDYRREKGTICDAIKFLHPHYAPTIIPTDGKDSDVPTREEGE